MARVAKQVSEEFGGRWEIGLHLGIFRAVRTGLPPGATAVPVHASDEDELRGNLAARETIDKFAAADAERRESGVAP
jgi:CBS domain-containing protein